MLTFVLTFEFYDMVKNGVKTHEYRAANSFWNSRICKLNIGDKIVFRRAYTKEYLVAVVTSIDFICRNMLPGYAKDFFKPYKRYFHDIGFEIEKK